MRLFLPVLVLIATACANRHDARDGLVIYSTHGKELLTEYETLFEKDNPAINVQWLDMGSQDVLDRLRSEKGNPQADLWWGAPSILFQQGEREGLLQAYKPTWANHVLPEAHSAQDQWYGTYETPEVIAFNAVAVKPGEAPRDWDDLLDSKWQNRLIIRDPLASGTMRAIFCAMILRFYSASGSPEDGYRWLKKLDANTKDYVANLTLLSQKLARQEGWITVWNMPDIELQRSRYSYPLAYVIPKSGTPVVTEGIALVAGSKRPEAGKRFYEFVTSKESLHLAAQKFFRIPCRKDIAPTDLPDWIKNTPVSPMPLDWKLLEEKSNEWMKYWDANIRNKGKS